MKQNIIRINNINSELEHKTNDLDWAIGINNYDEIKSPKSILDVKEYKYDDDGNYVLYEGLQYVDDMFKINIIKEDFYIAGRQYDSTISELYNGEQLSLTERVNVTELTDDDIDWDNNDEDNSTVYGLEPINN